MSFYRKLAPAIAILAAVSFAVTPAEAAKGRKAKLAAGVVAGAVAAGVVGAIVSSNNQANASGYNGYGNPAYAGSYANDPAFAFGTPAPHSYGYVTQHSAPSYYVEEHVYAQPRGYGYHNRMAGSDKAINACSRAGRKLYGFRHGRIEQVNAVEPVGRGLFRVDAYGSGFYGPQASHVVCVSDNRGNVRDFAVY